MFEKKESYLKKKNISFFSELTTLQLSENVEIMFCIILRIYQNIL